MLKFFASCVLLTVSHVLFAQKYFEFYPRNHPDFKGYIISISEQDWNNVGVYVSKTDTSFYTTQYFKSHYTNGPISFAPESDGERTNFGYKSVFNKFRLIDIEPWPKMEDYRVFHEGVRLYGTRLKNFDLSEAEFKGTFLLEWASIDSGSIFRDITFNGLAYFISNKFMVEGKFDNVKFLGDTRFDGNQMTDRTRFEKVLFQGFLSISQQQFKRVSFDRSIFANTESRFSGVRFDEYASFDGAVFHSGKIFEEVYLPDTLNFNGVQFRLPSSELFDFRGCYYDNNRTETNRCVIYLNNTDASKLILPFDRFRIGGLSSRSDRIASEDFIYDERYVTIIESLIKNCREAGMIESAEGWDIVLKGINNINTWGLWGGRFINGVNRYWWNYGYAKRYILWGWLPGLFVTFLALNLLVSKWLLSFYRDDELGKNFGLSPSDPGNHKKFTYIFFLTAILYFGLKIKHSAVDYRNTGGVLYLYLMYMVGSIHVAFALSYILNIY